MAVKMVGVSVKRKGGLEFAMHCCRGGKGVPGEFALGVDAEAAARVVHDGLSALFGARPLPSPRTESGGLPFPDAE